MPGSHVIVKAQDLDEYTIRLAAKIAAYYSKGKNSSSVPVNYTLVKTLKKPAGSKPGKVILDKLGQYKFSPKSKEEMLDLYKFLEVGDNNENR